MHILPSDIHILHKQHFENVFAGSYFKFKTLELPVSLQSKHSCINEELYLQSGKPNISGLGMARIWKKFFAIPEYTTFDISVFKPSFFSELRDKINLKKS